MYKIIDYLVDRGLVVLLISLFLILLGSYVTFNKINREAFPNVNLDKIQINVAQPGASPEEMERLVIIPIEQELKTLDGIDKTNSTAFPGSARIDLELDPDASNRKTIANDVQLAVDRARLPQSLPDDPVVTEIDGRVFPIIQLAISAPRNELAMKMLGDKIEEDLLHIDGVARIQVQGDRNAEIRIVVKPDKLKQHRVTIGDIANLLRSWNINSSGGNIDTVDGQRVVRIVGEYKNAEDVKKLVLRANEYGHGLTIADVADVSVQLEKATMYQDVAGKPAVHMIVLKKTDADIISTVDKIKQYLKVDLPKRYGDDISVDSFEDFSRFARLRLGVLTNNGMVGIVLVLISLVVFLRASVAISTTLSLPIVFLSGLFILYMSGMTLNLISMMGFIMVLGMLVDDAIMIGENIAYHMEKGVPAHQAAVKGSMELISPVTTTIMTTVIAFVPLLFMSGIIGKFVFSIPIVVITLLVLSWLESFLILPNHVSHLTHAGRKVPERKWLLGLENVYAAVLRWAIRHSWITILLTILMFVGSIALATHMKFRLFPPVGIEQYMVRATAEPGINLEQMQRKLIAVDKYMRSRINPEYLETTLVTSGQIAKDSGDPIVLRGSRFGQIRAIYIPAVLREEHDALKDMMLLSHELPKKFPELAFAFEELKPGPPTGRALQVELSGFDFNDADAAAKNLIQFLRGVKGVTTIESDAQPGDKEIRVTVDHGLAAYAGVDLATIADHVNAAGDGLRVSTTRWGSEEVDITIRFPEQRVAGQLAHLQQLQIPNKRGGLVRLDKIARFSETEGYSTIRHAENVRVLNVLANIDPEILTSVQINKLVAEQQDKWLGEYKDKVNVKFGGENEKNEESVADLKTAFLFAMLGILFLLAIQFNNLSYPIAVMLAIPFGIIGVILSFYLHDLFWKPMPLSFMSLLGTVALSGVVVNSSLVLLVFVQRFIQEGMNYKEAIIQAGRRRLRAVILTAATTIFGLLPTAYGWGGLDPFVSPMALALSWGLIFSTLITLIVIPAIVSAVMGARQYLRSLRH